MNRWLAGIFDPSARSDTTRVARALSDERASTLALGALTIAYSGAQLEDHSTVCLLDGLLTNTAELGEALSLAPDTPPERLLKAAWRRWGADLLARLRGEYALLLWDRERATGLLARDHLGARSLFLHETGGALRFACEIHHLLALLPQRPGPDPVGVAHWITMSNYPGSATLFQGIHRLDPGTALLLEHSGAHRRAYWRPRFQAPLEGSTDELAATVRMALDRAVGRRIAEDGRTCVLMSGGLDSSSVAALAAEQAQKQAMACSAVFPEHRAVDESELIGELRSTLGLDSLIAEVRAGGMLASALESTSTWDLPLRSWGDFWALPLLRAAVSEGATVTLGGDGGDELFGARSYVLADKLAGGRPLQAFALAHELPGAGDRPARRELARVFGELAVLGALPYRLHTAIERARMRRQAPGWMRPELARALVDSDDPLAWKRLHGPSWWAEVAHGLTRGVEELGVFEHQRRRAVSAGLEARHPLFDLDLLELCLRLPPEATLDRYRSRPLLRAAMSGLLPDSVRMRPGKAVFDSLLLDCMRGEDGATIEGLLTDSGAELGAYVDTQALAAELFERVSPSERSFRWMWQVWRLTSAECWLRGQSGDPQTLRGLPASAPRISIARDQGTPVADDSYVFPP